MQHIDHPNDKAEAHHHQHARPNDWIARYPSVDVKRRSLLQCVQPRQFSRAALAPL